MMPLPVRETAQPGDCGRTWIETAGSCCRGIGQMVIALRDQLLSPLSNDDPHKRTTSLMTATQPYRGCRSKDKTDASMR